MATTIQVSDTVREVLDKQKISSKESFNDVLERILEDTMELNARTRKELEEARREIKAGNFISLEDLEKEIGV